VEKEQGRTTIIRSAFQPIWSLSEKVGVATVSRPVSLSREILKLSTMEKRTKKEEGLLQLLTYRQR
jgi:hypothetical protein